jgi:tRNA-Thr(GGU) m(6)t(6)A37 methyltransferase TsaA
MEMGDTTMPNPDTYEVRPIGIVRSTLTTRDDAPRQGWLGAPDAWIDVRVEAREGLLGIEPGDDLDVITWLHLADRTVRRVHPRGDETAPLRGVFATRSPARPNPLGIHRVTVLEVVDDSLHVEPLEAVDGTPVVDIKAGLRPNARDAPPGTL